MAEDIGKGFGDSNVSEKDTILLVEKDRSQSSTSEPIAEQNKILGEQFNIAAKKSPNMVLLSSNASGTATSVENNRNN